VSLEISTVAQVATPRTESALTNWLVQVVPAYSLVEPSASAWMRAEVREVMANLVVVAFVAVALPVILRLESIVEKRLR